jgi:hypothetical protein
MTFKEFCIKYCITATATKVAQNPNMADWKDATHWEIVLTRGRDAARTVTYFSQGSAHTAFPTAPKVMACLASDARGTEEVAFEEWASDFGYDTDSRKAEATFHACQEAAQDLRRFLGKRYAELLQCEEE